jgi:hypothetical protein
MESGELPGQARGGQRKPLMDEWQVVRGKVIHRMWESAAGAGLNLLWVLPERLASDAILRPSMP